MQQVMRARVVAMVAAMFALAGEAMAQAKPDLSGSWLYVEERSKMGDAFSGTLAYPSEIEISVKGTELHVVGTSNHLKPVEVVYRLDGTESSTQTAAGLVKAKTAWEGNTLVVSGTRSYPSPMGDISITTKDVYTIKGDVLTVERTQQTQGLDNPARGTTVYVRVKPTS